jgi:hypothetical protein
MCSGGARPIAPPDIEEHSVSYAKFAPITGSLFARKGEAAPSLSAKRSFGWAAEIDPVPQHFREPAHEPLPQPVAQHAPDHQDICDAVAKPLPITEKHRRIVVSFSPSEFERLGIAAVKKGLTRHDLVRVTINLYLQRLATELNSRCACLNGGEVSRCNGAIHED